MISIKPDIKYRLVDLRQDPNYSVLRADFRRAIKYIEDLEKEVLYLRKKLSNKRDNSVTKSTG